MRGIAWGTLVLVLGACGGANTPGAAEPTSAQAPERSPAETARAESTERLEAEDFEGARAAAERAIELEPGSAAAHTARGMACRGLDEHACARDSFAEAMRLDPAADVGLLLGDAHRALSEVGDAERAYRAVFVANEARVEARSALVEVHIIRLQMAEQAMRVSGQQGDVAGELLAEVQALLAPEAGDDAALEDLRHEVARMAERGAANARGSGGSGGRVSRGVSLGSLGTRESQMPIESRRARRAPRPQTLDPRAIEAVIEEHAHEVRFCMEREFRNRPDVQGSIVVAGHVAAAGTVADVEIRSSTVRNVRVHQCILDTFRRWRFPSAPVETPFEHPFVLSSR